MKHLVKSGRRNSWRTESGRAITNARIRQRESAASLDPTILNSGGSCKHLCCHEGVDKPPKAPKKASTAVNTIVEPGPNPNSKSAPRQSSVQTKLPLGKTAHAKEAKKIETINLAHTRDPIEYAKVAPRAYRSLHQLHEKVNRSSSATPVLSNTKPSFSYKKGDQPRLTFLSQSATPGKKDQDRSSDYGAAWMDDLPSPTDLLHADDEPDGVPKQTITGHDDLSSLPPASDPQDFEFEFTGHAENEQRTDPTTADAMDSAIFDDGRYKEAMGNLEAVGNHEVSGYFAQGPLRRVGKGPSPQKLFMSTDSPEKPSTPTSKRNIDQAQDDDVNEANDVPEAKRERLDETVDAPTLSSSPKDNGAPESIVRTIRPGYPDWVYEFDPAFVAEWEPYVEFV